MSVPNQSESAGGASDREIVIRRVLNAPRERVYQAYTDPRTITHWWGPQGFSTTTHHMDLRAGGEWRFTMHGPDGRDYQNLVRYLEVVPNERLVYRHGDVDELEPVDFHSTITFEDVGGKTRLTLRMVFASPADRDRVEREYGAIEGGRQTVGRLADYLAGGTDQSTAAMTLSMASDREIVLTRYFHAPRRLVFEAHSKPEHIRRWWGCRKTTLASCEMDFRPGGAWRFVLRGPGGDEHPFRGEYREIVPPARISYTFIDDVEGLRDHLAVETLTFEEVDGKTRLTTRIVLDSVESRDRYLNSGMEWAVAEGLDRLSELLATMS